jgi:hypothetical protein
MNTNVVQRWRERRGSYRPAGETINTCEYEVAALDKEEAKAFVLRHHYLQCFPAQRRCFGLYWWGRLVGVAVFSQPMRKEVLKGLPGAPEESMALGRLVLLDEVRANAESWFIARCFELLRGEGFVGVASFSDPFRYTTTTGTVLSPGHVGTIYQATNGVYRGRSRADYIHLLPNGRNFQNDSMTKVRHLKEGWRYSAQLLVDFGAPMLDPKKDDPKVWLATWLPRICRKEKHPGNHKYLWALNRRDRKHLPESMPYPKLHMAA